MKFDISFELPEKLFLKDPQQSSYGKRLLGSTVELLLEIGFESFTFKKLGAKMSSSEVSIYRYFENKHLLLLFMYCWYWEWMNYTINTNIRNLKDPQEKLMRSINTLIFAHKNQKVSSYLDEELLFQVMLNEGSKTYHVHNIDDENKYGFFIPYKSLVAVLAEIILELNPKFDYPRTLGSNIFEMILNQHYYAKHLPRLTNIKERKDKLEQIETLCQQFVFAILLG